MTSVLQYIEIPFPSEQILASVSDSVKKVKKNQMIMPVLYHRNLSMSLFRGAHSVDNVTPTHSINVVM
jgi:hypothetical protein